jgi:hypothetical protein
MDFHRPGTSPSSARRSGTSAIIQSATSRERRRSISVEATRCRMAPVPRPPRRGPRGARCEVARYVAGAAPRRTFGHGQLGQGAGCRARLVRDTTMPQSSSTKSKAIFGASVTCAFKSPEPTQRPRPPRKNERGPYGRTSFRENGHHECYEIAPLGRGLPISSDNPSSRKLGPPKTRYNNPVLRPW